LPDRGSRTRDRGLKAKDTDVEWIEWRSAPYLLRGARRGAGPRRPGLRTRRVWPDATTRYPCHSVPFRRESHRSKLLVLLLSLRGRSVSKTGVGVARVGRIDRSSRGCRCARRSDRPRHPPTRAMPRSLPSSTQELGHRPLGGLTSSVGHSTADERRGHRPDRPQLLSPSACGRVRRAPRSARMTPCTS
jgi:hypothetical protein